MNKSFSSLEVSRLFDYIIMATSILIFGCYDFSGITFTTLPYLFTRGSLYLFLPHIITSNHFIYNDQPHHDVSKYLAPLKRNKFHLYTLPLYLDHLDR